MIPGIGSGAGLFRVALLRCRRAGGLTSFIFEGAVDPPLGRDEKAVLEQMLALSGLEGRLDVMTPRQLAARGG